MVLIESRPFTRRLLELAGKAEADNVLRRIQADLVENPERGDLVKGLGGIRKARAANPRRGKGKRGGFRYLYVYLARRDHIHLLLILDKGEQADLTTEQRKIVGRMARELWGERWQGKPE